jgi:hypothetical protein
MPYTKVPFRDEMICEEIVSWKLKDKYILYPKGVMEKEGVIHLQLYMAGLL